MISETRTEGLIYGQHYKSATMDTEEEAKEWVEGELKEGMCKIASYAKDKEQDIFRGIALYTLD